MRIRLNRATAATLLLLLIPATPLDAFAKLSDHPSLSYLIGTFKAQNGGTVVVEAKGNTVILKSNFDLTAKPECQTRISRPLAINVDPQNPEFAEVSYRLSKGNCPNIDGSVTLHHNVSIFGSDVYLIDVVISRGVNFSYSQNSSNGITRRWHLSKIQ